MNQKGTWALEPHRTGCKSASPTDLLCDFGQVTQTLSVP